MSEHSYSEADKKEKDSGQPSPVEGRGKYRCKVCGYIYDPQIGDPDNGIGPGTAFEDLPDSWVCPECGVGKEEFERVE